MISIITPVYNGKRFIEYCIKNVIDQKCPDMEHIIVDGGSTDSTVEIIQRYAERYWHIRWVSEKDKGQSDAMNKGIRLAEGNIIGILNADDYYEPNVLSRIESTFHKLSEPSFITGNCNIWNELNSSITINKPRNLSLDDLLKGPMIHPFPANPSAYFYHKSLHDIVGYYDTDDHYTMDLDFILRAVQVAHTYYFDEIWGNFRLFEDTKTYRNIKSGGSYLSKKRTFMKYIKNNSFRDKLLFNLRYYYQNIMFPWVSYNYQKLIRVILNPKKLISYVYSKFRSR